MAVPQGRQVRTKKKCCKSSPKRCKRCPAAMKKLEKRGLASKLGKRSYVIHLEASKRDLKAARRR